MSKLMDKELLAKKLKTAQFQRKYINTPCLIISVLLLVFGLVVGSTKLTIMWLVLSLLNVFALMLNNHLIFLLQKTDAIHDEIDRKKKINEPCGRK